MTYYEELSQAADEIVQRFRMKNSTQTKPITKKKIQRLVNSKLKANVKGFDRNDLTCLVENRLEED